MEGAPVFSGRGSLRGACAVRCSASREPARPGGLRAPGPAAARVGLRPGAGLRACHRRPPPCRLPGRGGACGATRDAAGSAGPCSRRVAVRLVGIRAGSGPSSSATVSVRRASLSSGFRRRCRLRRRLPAVRRHPRGSGSTSSAALRPLLRRGGFRLRPAASGDLRGRGRELRLRLGGRLGGDFGNRLAGDRQPALRWRVPPRSADGRFRLGGRFRSPVRRSNASARTLRPRRSSAPVYLASDSPGRTKKSSRLGRSCGCRAPPRSDLDAAALPAACWPGE